MSNKTRLQTNNTNLQSLIDKANALPDAGSGGGGTSVEYTDITIKTKRMPTAASFVEYISHSAVDSAGTLTLMNVTSPVYLQTITVVAGTLIFIKTQNNPTNCNVTNPALELVVFDATVGAVIKVLNANEYTGQSITFS